VRPASADTDTQLKAKDVLEQTFNPDAADPSYVVALNLLSASPSWLTSMQRAADVSRPRPARRRALPAAGRHEGALTKRLDSPPPPTCAP
jgi:preprotein translocase subunit SecD